MFILKLKGLDSKEIKPNKASKECPLAEVTYRESDDTWTIKASSTIPCADAWDLIQYCIEKGTLPNQSYSIEYQKGF